VRLKKDRSRSQVCMYDKDRNQSHSSKENSAGQRTVMEDRKFIKNGSGVIDKQLKGRKERNWKKTTVVDFEWEKGGGEERGLMKRVGTPVEGFLDGGMVGMRFSRTDLWSIKCCGFRD